VRSEKHRDYPSEYRKRIIIGGLDWKWCDPMGKWQILWTRNKKTCEDEKIKELKLEI